MENKFMDEKVITVVGKGGIHIIPDVTRVELRLESLHKTYEEAYELISLLVCLVQTLESQFHSGHIGYNVYATFSNYCDYFLIHKLVFHNFTI